MNPIYFITHTLFRAASHAFFRLQIINYDNLLQDGPCIYVVNHQSFLDPPIVGQMFEKPVHYLARKTLLNSAFMNFVLPLCNTLPIDQNQPDPGSILKVLRLLKSGGRIVIFPEGSRCADGQIHDAMPGIGLIIGKLAHVPVQPIRIEGAYDCLPIHSHKLKFRPITLSVGKPIEFTPEELKAKGRAAQNAIGRKVMDAIRALPLES